MASSGEVSDCNHLNTRQACGRRRHASLVECAVGLGLLTERASGTPIPGLGCLPERWGTASALAHSTEYVSM